MATDGPIVSGSGIRGVYGSALTARDVIDYASAFGELVGPGRVVVGRDTRRSGPAVEAAVASALMSVGCTPVLLGVVPTPTVQLEAMRPDAVGGIAVTSSHNPGEWNALKLIGADGVFLRSGARARLAELISIERRWVGHRDCGLPEVRSGSLDSHVDLVSGLPWVERDGRPLRFVLDVTGGTGALLGPAMMEALGASFEVIHPAMLATGDFPREAEPTGESLADLAEAVAGSGADGGMAFDPDGDRLALVDENGRVMGEDCTVALALDLLLEVRPGPAVVNLSTSMLADEVASRHGCVLYRSPVGEVNVVEEMERRGALSGGEGNGGVIDAGCHPGRDSAVAMACLVSLLRRRPGMSLSSWAASLPELTMRKLKMRIARPFEELEPAIASAMGDPDDRRDGLWFDRGRGWTHVRPSGTEPVVRFISESREAGDIERDLALFRKAVDSACAE